MKMTYLYKVKFKYLFDLHLFIFLSLGSESLDFKKRLIFLVNLQSIQVLYHISSGIMIPLPRADELDAPGLSEMKYRPILP